MMKDGIIFSLCRGRTMAKFWQPKEGETVRLVFVDEDPAIRDLPIWERLKPAKVAFRCVLCDMGYPVTHGFWGLYGKPVKLSEDEGFSD